MSRIIRTRQKTNINITTAVPYALSYFSTHVIAILELTIIINLIRGSIVVILIVSTIAETSSIIQLAIYSSLFIDIIVNITDICMPMRSACLSNPMLRVGLLAS